MNQAQHALVVGGTGMLRQTCLRLACNGWRVSIIARSRDDLESMATQAAHDAAGTGGRGAIHPLPLDYRDSPALVKAIPDAMAMFGPIALTVAWIHSTAPEAPRLIAQTIAEASPDFRFIHVLGIEAADPSSAGPAREPWIARLQAMRYQRVILGFMFRRNGQTRWLTDDEICGGIERAIDSEADESIVGIVEPWERHPAL